MKRQLLLSTFAILLVSVCSWAQFTDDNPETGENPLGSYFKTDIDSVSLTNGNLHLTIPVFSLPGRELPVALLMDYNSQSYVLRQTFLINGQMVGSYESKQWRKLSSLMSGTVTANRTYGSHTFANNLYTLYWGLTFVWTSPTGRQITFTTARTQTCTSIWNNSPNPPTCHENPSPIDAQIFDNVVATSSDPDFITFLSGTVFYYGPPASVIRKDGTRLPALSPSTGAGLPLLTTTNGNQLQGNAASQSTTNYGIGLTDELPGTDTVGRTITYANDDDHVNFTAWFNTLETFTLTDANGQAQVYVIKWKPVTVNNTYEESGYPSQNDGHKEVDYIQLPNGKRYTLTYNPEGMVSKVTMPSGAYIRYEYEHPCGHRGHVARRYLSPNGQPGPENERQTSYSYTYTTIAGACYPNSPAQYRILSTTVTDPTGAQTQHFFTYVGGGGQPLEGTTLTVSTNQVLKRIDRTWVYTTYNDPIGGAHYYTELRTETTTMDSMVRKTQYTYDGHQNLTHQEEYDWGLNAPGSRVRYIDKTYLDSACTSNGICDRVTSEKIFTDSAILIAETDYDYDVYGTYSVCGQQGVDNSLISRSGTIPGWVSPAGARGNVTAVKRWLKNDTENRWLTTVQRYDVLGNKVKVTDPLCHATSTEYADHFSDSQERYTFAFPKRVTDAGLFYVETTYDFNTGLPTQTSDQLGRTTKKKYDLMNRVTSVIEPNNKQTTYAYDDTNLITTKEVSVDTASPTPGTLLGNKGHVETYFDKVYRVTQTRTNDPEGTIYVDAEYDAKGRKSKTSNPRRSTESAVWTQLAYDALDRPTVTTAADGSTVQYSYNGNQTTVTDESGNQRRYTYDGDGRMTKVEEPYPSLATPVVTTYSYNVLGNMTQSSQGNQNPQIRTWSFDSLGRMTSQSLPESGTTSFTYNDDGLLSTKADARGITTNLSYDNLHRPTSRSSNDSTGTPAVTFGYDSDPNDSTSYPHLKTFMKDAVGCIKYKYDSMDRLIQEIRTLGTNTTNCNNSGFSTGYSYNIKGDLTQITYPSARVVTFSYNTGAGYASSRLLSVSDGTTNTTVMGSLSFRAAGLMVASTLGNGLSQSYEHNSRLQETAITAAVSGTTLMNFSYNYGTSTNNTGRVLSRTDSVQPEHSMLYSYDSIYRLIQASSTDASWDISWGFDVWSNRTTQTPRGLVQTNNIIGTQTNGYLNNRLQITCSGFPGSSCYDASGNQIGDPTPLGLKTFSFNAENQLTEYTGPNSANGTYSYDGDGRRMKRTIGAETTYYFYGPTGVLSEFTTSDSLSTLTTASSTDRALYRTSDKLGSAVLILNSSGSVIEDSRLLPYGEPWMPQFASANDKKFTTYQRDQESGLDYASRRFYSPSLARLSSVDAGAPVDFTPKTLNRYVYSGNDPVNYIDTDGLAQQCWTNPESGRRECTPPPPSTAAQGLGRPAIKNPSPTRTLRELDDHRPESCSISMYLMAECEDDDPAQLGTGAGRSIRGNVALSVALAVARAMGLAGEAIVAAKLGLDKNKELLRGTISGINRIPDFWDKAKGVMYEVKNVSSLSYTSQIRDMAEWAKANSQTFIIYARQGADVSREIMEQQALGHLHIEWFTWP